MKSGNFHSVVRGIQWVIAGLLAALLLSAFPSGSDAQFSVPSPNVGQENNRPPTGVTRYGAIEVAPVTLDGEELLKVVAPTVRDRANSGKIVPVEIRAEVVEANLKRVIAEDQPQDIQEDRGFTTNFDPKTLQVFPTQLRGQTVLVAKDAYRSQLQELITITNQDADYYGLTVDELAQRWQATLYKKLSEELKERLPERFEHKISVALLIGIGTCGISILLWVALWLVNRRDKRLTTEQKAELSAVDPAIAEQAATANHPEATTSSDSGDRIHNLRQQFTLKRRRNILAAIRWLLSVGQLVTWIYGTGLIFNLFPQTQQLGGTLLGIPIKLLLIWLTIAVLNWIGDLLLNRLAHAWENDELSGLFFAFEDAQRKSLRISTTMRALRGLKTFLISCLGIAWTLQLVGVPIASVLAGGAIVAFAISLGFQNLVKDLVNGCLILWEDQYGIGDVIAIDRSTGLVENMNLRITQLRDAEGRLITIPNSSIVKVENLTRTWSRVNFEIEVDYETDIDHALTIINDIAQQLYQEPGWRDRMIEPPEVLGVEQLSHTGTLIRVWIKTKPLEQWPVGREFRRRVRHALDSHQIRIGTPQQILRYEEEESLLNSMRNGQTNTVSLNDHSTDLPDNNPR
ncbi:MAG: mechanosensitive ion channel family protein [Oscillatoriales cyanobacterium C42_A2020_001]|nr:mechanosensitive ion channel family protein [Leptolyngbyaceae cyanobacterium C42_A2020_001]